MTYTCYLYNLTTEVLVTAQYLRTTREQARRRFLSYIRNSGLIQMGNEYRLSICAERDPRNVPVNLVYGSYVIRAVH